MKIPGFPSPRVIVTLVACALGMFANQSSQAQSLSSSPNPSYYPSAVNVELEVPQGCIANQWEFYWAYGTSSPSTNFGQGQGAANIPATFYPPAAGTYSLQARGTKTNTCTNPNSNIISQTVKAATPTGTQGIIYPKYVVVGVTYAPPGVSSDVQYTGTTSVGSTSTYSSSFTQGYSVGVSSTLGINIPSGTPTPTGGVTITVGEENTSTQTQNTSTSVTLNKSTSVSYQTAGYPTTFSPSGTPAPSLPHDYDTIQVWLNPELIFTATPQSGNTPASIVWNGYAYDPYDQAGPDIASIQVGCLNGHFSTTYCSTQQGVLNRAWVVSEPIKQMSPINSATVTAAGCAPQTAESPSICPKTQDAENILAADPLAYNPDGKTYSLFDSQPLPITTSDGRYTQLSGANNPNPVQYVPNETESYNVTQMNTQVQSNGGSQKFEEKITISATVNSGFWNIFNKSTTYTNTDDFTQTYTWLNTLTKVQTVADAFTVKGSAPPNYVAGEFIAYQDNLYGTFLLVPSN